MIEKKVTGDYLHFKAFVITYKKTKPFPKNCVYIDKGGIWKWTIKI